LTLHVSKNGEVLVKAPLLVPKFLIDRFVLEKKEWIQKTLEKVAKRKPPIRTYTEGEAFLFLGNAYKISYGDSKEIIPKDGIFHFPKALSFRAKKELETWYQKEAKEIITKRVEYQASKMHAHYKDIFFSDTQSKWGTCFTDNTLQFNWRLIMAPLIVIDYVVIHELTHTTEKNHKENFWRKVRLFTPAYRQHRKWLDQNAHLLIL